MSITVANRIQALALTTVVQQTRALRDATAEVRRAMTALDTCLDNGDAVFGGITTTVENVVAAKAALQVAVQMALTAGVRPADVQAAVAATEWVSVNIAD
jgi:hypothetical protein